MTARKFLDTKNYTNYAEWIRSPAVRDRIEDLLLNESSVVGSLLGEDIKSTYLEPHMSGRTNMSNQILRLVTVETYLNRVLEVPEDSTIV